MNEDRFMRELGARAKEENAEDSSLPSALARPFDAGELDRILDGATAKLNAPAGNVVSISSARKRWGIIAGVAAPLAAAAVAVLTLRPSAPSLPTYDLLVEGGERPTRSADAPSAAPGAPIRIVRDGRLVLVLRPRVPGTADARARVMIDNNGALTRWEADARASEEGAIRIDARGAPLAALPAGLSTLVVFVSTEASLPDSEPTARKAMRGEIAGVQTLLQPIDVTP